MQEPLEEGWTTGRFSTSSLFVGKLANTNHEPVWRTQIKKKKTLIMCKNFNSGKHQSSFFVKLAMLAFVFSFSFSINANAQGFLKGLADRAKEKIKEKVTDKVERSVDNAMDNVLNGKKKSKKSRSNSEEYSDYSEDTSSTDYEESSSYDDETNNSASNESSEIESVDLTSWVEMAEIGEKDVHQYALVPKACVNKIFEGFEDKLTGDVQEQMMKRKLNENNKAVISEIVRKAKSYSLGNRLYSAVDFLDNSDLIVVSTSQEPKSDVRDVRGEWGVIDKNGKVVIPLKHYQFSRDASKMDALMFVDKKGGKVGAYHLDGRLRIPFEHEYINPARTKHKKWFVTTDENGKNALYDENMNLKLTADNIEIVFGTLNGKDDTYIYTYNGAGSAKVYKNYDENLNLLK